MMKALRKAKYVALDTEFPGIVYQLNEESGGMNGFNNMNLNSYSLVRENCNKLNVIQMGFCLSDENGNLVS